MNESYTIDDRSLTERAADMIEGLVIKKQFKPGEKIPNEIELTNLLNVGRGTVREAIKILVSRNVLEIRRGSGTFVCQNVGVTNDPLGFRFEYDKKKLGLDLCEIRMMVEPRIAYLAAKHASEDDIEAIQSVCNEVKDLIRAGQNYGSKDIEFHTKIASSTANRVVPKLIPIINMAIDTFIDLTNYGAAGRAYITHQQVVDAIRSRDPEGAYKAMKQHLIDNCETLQKLPDLEPQKLL